MKGPPLCSLANSAAAQACAAGVRRVSRSAVRVWRANGAGRRGTGWVREARSPGAVLAGNGVSSTGKSGAPVSRSSTKT